MLKKVILPVTLMIFLTITGCAESQTHKNVCPVDGQPPQWIGQRKGKSCEFFHYSDMERHSHSWWADCDQRETPKSNPPPNGPPSMHP
jgi:hypothetical protein